MFRMTLLMVFRGRIGRKFVLERLIESMTALGRDKVISGQFSDYSVLCEACLK